jgi:heptosyltransferase III
VSKAIDLTNKTVVISRTDSIGDVMLTLPMCNWLKAQFEGVKIVFLGRNYTRDIVTCFPAVDEFFSYDELEMLPVQARVEAVKQWKADVFIHVYPHKELAKLAKKAKIGIRVGTSHRSFHLLTCSHRINFTRKNSDLHEAQLNFELLRPFGLENIPSLDEVTSEMLTFKAPSFNEEFSSMIGDKPIIVLHPKSKGSAVEWPIENYIELAHQLVGKNFRVLFSGTAQEGEQFRSLLPDHSEIIDITGKFTLTEFIAFLGKVDGIVACSTGPLHIAAALGKTAVGLYIDKRPMHPGRWAPLGPKAKVIAPTTKKPSESDIRLIEVGEVIEALG